MLDKYEHKEGDITEAQLRDWGLWSEFDRAERVYAMSLQASNRVDGKLTKQEVKDRVSAWSAFGRDVDTDNFDDMSGVAGFSPSTGGGSSSDGGDMSDAAEDRLDDALGHVGGYDFNTNSAADPISSGSKGFDPEKQYDDLDSEQQERLSDENGNFTDDGDLKESETISETTRNTIEDNNAEDAAGLPNDADNSDPSTMTSPSSDDSDSSNSPASTPVPDAITDALPDGVSPGMAAVAVAAVVYFGVIR